MALNEGTKGNGLPEPSLEDLLILGTSLIRRHDKGMMTDQTIIKYVNGVTHTYGLSVDQAMELEEELKKKR